MPTDREPWPRTVWLEAVYSSQLEPLERLVAAIYADHAKKGRTAWVTLQRLQVRSGMSRASAVRARNRLVGDGWLVLVEDATPRAAAVYRLEVGVSHRHPRGLTQTPQRSQSETSEVSERHPRGLTQTPNQVLNPGTNQGTEPRRPRRPSTADRAVQDALAVAAELRRSANG